LKEPFVQATRLRILEILKEHGDVTVAELARQLGMAPVSVRHHLDVLQGEQLICAPRVRHGGTVGRPRQVYALTEAASAYFPSNHGKLALGLLEEIKGLLSPGDLQALFDRLADSMVAEARVLPGDATVKERVEHAVDFLNERGYLARYELIDGRYVIYTLNCPYAGLAEHHRELCGMDKRMLDRLVGGTPSVVTRIADGDCRCAYDVEDSVATVGRMASIQLVDTSPPVLRPGMLGAR
jgi:predicted ArsR family transcriptional regulator